MLNKSGFQLHAYLINSFFILGLFFYGIFHPKGQKMGLSILWVLAFAVFSFVADLLFDFIRCPLDMEVDLAETIGVLVFYFIQPSLLFGFAAFFVAVFIRRFAVYNLNPRRTKF